MTTKTLKIDFVSDVSCPWCIIGLKALEQAADRLKGEVALDMHFQPFELNPQMGPEGQDINEHLQEKYGSTPEQLERNREAIAARGADLGFTFGKGKRSRVYNTFDAHRLLHWAEEVREREQLYLQNGIHSVPAIIINERHLIQGGQPVEVFEQALRQIASQA